MEWSIEHHASTYYVIYPSAHGIGSKGQNIYFLKVVMLHIKLREWSIEHHASTSSVLTHSVGLLGRGQKVKHSFLKEVILHIKLKGKEHNAPRKHIFCANTHYWPLWSDQNIKAFFF